MPDRLEKRECSLTDSTFACYFGVQLPGPAVESRSSSGIYRAMGETVEDGSEKARRGGGPLGLSLVIVAVSALIAAQVSEVALAKTKKDPAAGREAAEAANAPGEGGVGATPFGSGQVSATLARHRDELMAHPNVVAVSDGVCAEDHTATPRPCINVYVDREIAPGELPAELDGVPIQVVEAGKIDTLPMK